MLKMPILQGFVDFSLSVYMRIEMAYCQSSLTALSKCGLMSWLIDRAFLITNATKRHQEGQHSINRKTNENKALLLKVLYDINPQNVLQIFSKNA